MVTTDESTLLTSAIHLAKAGKATEALRAFETARTNFSGSALINLEFGNFVYHLGDLDKALLLYHDAAELDPSLTQAVSNKAAILFSLERWDEAIATFDLLLAQSPGDAGILNNIGNVLFERGDYEAALLKYDEAGKSSPGWWEPVHNQATTCTALENVEAAITLHEQALEIAPLEAEAVISACNCFLEQGRVVLAARAIRNYRAQGSGLLETELIHGRVLVAEKRLEEAVEFYQELERALPESIEIQTDLASALLESGEVSKAVSLLEEYQGKHGDSVLVLMLLAKACMARGEFLRAAELYEKIYEKWPETPGIARFIGAAYLQAGLNRKSVEWYSQALARNGGSAAAYVGLSSSLIAIHKPDEALVAAEEAIRLDPVESSGYFSAAAALLQLERYDDALGVCETGLSLDPSYAKCRAMKASILIKKQNFQEALEEIERAVNLSPDDLQILRIAIGIYRNCHLPLQAMALGAHFLKLEPSSIEVLSMVVDTVLTACAWQTLDEFSAALIKAVEMRIAAGNPVGICINNLHALPVSYKTMVEAGRNASDHILTDIAEHQQVTAFEVSRESFSSKKRIRIGYLLPYVRFHSMPLVIRDIVERHDREKFEVFGYCYSSVPKTPFANDFIAAFDGFHASTNRLMLAQAIHDDEIELLIDCSGHTESSCLDVAALRPAPVNIHFLGYSVSMGASFMDYFITDEISVPSGQSNYGPEKIIYMPDSFMPTMRPEINPDVPTRAGEGLPEEGIVFCNFNQPFKMEPRIFACWMEILNAVPGSVFWIGNWNEAADQNLRRAATEKGVDPARIITGTIVDHDKHLARLALADLSLDTFQHGGGITTVDCLWAGLPVVSVRGDTPGALLGATLLKAHGLPELVVTDFEEYKNLALEIVRDPDRLKALKARCWTNKDTTPLFDVRKYLANLETGYLEVSARYRAGDTPDHIRVRDICNSN
jgi:protein O-GlcNAc transferase